MTAAPPLAPLPATFFDGPVLSLARRLVGRILVHAAPEGLAAGRIVETEAYRGPLDLAAHSAGGRRTKRTEAMFGAAGTAYMFRLYGMHWAFNIVAGRVGEPHAVLIRALEPVVGVELMAARRGVSKPATDCELRQLCSGPGKLCQALGLDGRHYGRSLLESGAETPALFVSEGSSGRIGRSPRINIDYAGPWVGRPWRFFESDNLHVSVRPRTVG